MISSAEEFVRLRTSRVRTEYDRAKCEDAPFGVWLDVIDRYPNMRSWVAHNKTVPIEILELLALDPDPDVRHAVASKRKLTNALFCFLSFDPEGMVRMCIATNRRTPLEVLKHLSCDSDEWVREMAGRSLENRRGPDDQEWIEV